MVVILLLGIHILLITLFALFIQTNKSRLNYTYLTLALCIPFVGELCLLAAEIGAVPAKSKYIKVPDSHHQTPIMKGEWIIPDDYEEIVTGEENQARNFLMDAIDNADEQQLSMILKKALYSQSSEVSHIAASALMRMNQKHEDAISVAKSNSDCMPNNSQFLVSYIDAVHSYIISQLPDKASLMELVNLEKSLLVKYLDCMPDDTIYHERLLNLSDAEAMSNE